MTKIIPKTLPRELDITTDKNTRAYEVTKNIKQTKTPYMTKKHFVVLAEELAGDKLFYTSAIKFHEKLERMIKYCEASNDRFDLKVFIAHIDKTYKNLCDDLNVKPELTKSSELINKPILNTVSELLTMTNKLEVDEVKRAETRMKNRANKEGSK